jgi:hypothetical protein
MIDAISGYRHGIKSPVTGFQSVESLVLGFESPVIGLESLEIETKIRANGAKLSHFNTF